MTTKDELDPKGLFADAYLIDGIRIEECRSIFLDWAISVKADDPAAILPKLIERHVTPEREDHPMTQVLREGLAEAKAPKRRGGRAGRLSPPA